MKISVIIPAYNGAATLAGAIESILRQTRAPEQIVVCDDCSSDSTVQVAARYEGRVEYVTRQTNGGLSANRNTALHAARGDWLLFLDQDDELLPHALEALASTVGQTGAGVAYGYVLLRGGEKRALHGLPWAAGEPPTPAGANFWWTAVTTTGCALFRRSLIDEVGEFDEVIWQAEDCEFWLRCGMVCRFAHCDTVVLKKHEMANSLGSNAAGSIWWRLYLQEKFLAWCAQRGSGHAFLGRKTASADRSCAETNLSRQGLERPHARSRAGPGSQRQERLAIIAAFSPNAFSAGGESGPRRPICALTRADAASLGGAAAARLGRTPCDRSAHL